MVVSLIDSAGKPCSQTVLKDVFIHSVPGPSVFTVTVSKRHQCVQEANVCLSAVNNETCRKLSIYCLHYVALCLHLIRDNTLILFG